MRPSTLLASLVTPLALLACSGTGPDSWEAYGEDGSEIINGTLDTTHDAVMAVFTNNTCCTGTMLEVHGTYGYVLTAAHCVTPLAPVVVVQADDYNDWGAIQYPVVDYEWHSAYSGEGSLFDFAMIRVNGASASTPVIPAIGATDSINVGTQVLNVGYGLTSYPNGNTSERHRTTNIVSGFVGGSQSTAVAYEYQQPSSGPCQGDSGGPGLTTSGALRVQGVISYGDPGCDQYGVSGRVSKVYNTFIRPYIDGGPIGPLTCDECLQASTTGQGACMGAVEGCFNNNDCTALLDCFDGCNGVYSCEVQCVNDHPTGWNLYLAIFDCVCDQACVSECENDGMCTGSGGTGGIGGTGGTGGTAGTGGTGADGATGGVGGSGATGATGGVPPTGGGVPSGDNWVAGDAENRGYDGGSIGTCAAAPGLVPQGRSWAFWLSLMAGLWGWARRRGA